MYRGLAALAAMGVAGAFAPAEVCALGAKGWTENDPATIRSLGDVVARQVELPLGDFGTGSARFDGEWQFGTYQMAALGHGQAAILDPERREQHLADMHAAIDHALQDDVWTFDREAWGDYALRDPAHDRHDHAVLGYLGLALSLERLLDPSTSHADVEDAVAKHLAARLKARGTRPIQTYPGEAFPVDMSACLGALALHAKAVHQPIPAEVDAAIRHWEQAYVRDGLLIQLVDPSTGAPWSPVRGSGTALASYFLGFTHPDVSRRLAVGLRDRLGGEVAGFGAVREYVPGTPGNGDIDSGPLVMGYSVSATGFSLAAARHLHDDAWFADLYATADAFGVPGPDGFTTGGPLGNAILYAMMTSVEVP